MSQSGFTPIQLFRTSTAAAVPTAGNLAAGELAINLTDERLYFKNAAGVVKLLASNSGSLGTVTSVDVSGGTTGLTTSGGPITSSGTITLAGTLGVANGGTGTATAFTAGSVVFAGASGVYSQDNANFFWDNANDRLGIGTATPSQRLEVNGAMRVGGASGVGFINFSSTVAFDTSAIGCAVTTGFGDSLGLAVQNATGVMTLATNSTERMRIDSTGNVGIGTQGPSSYGKLAVIGNIATSTDGGTVLSMRANAGATTLGAFNSTGSFLSFNTNASGSGEVERMRITSAGDVGIGTSSPAAPLSITRDNAAFRGQLSLQTVSSANFAQITFYDQSTLSGQIYQGYGSDKEINIVNPLTAGIALWTTNTERVRITAGGDVGIGTTAPNSKLHVSFSPPGSIPALGSGVGGVAIGPAASYGMLLGTISDGTGYIQQQRFDTGSSVYSLALQPNGGNVGIGTSSPGAKLHVVGTSFFASDMFTDQNGGIFFSGNGSYNVGIYSRTADLAFQANGSERMRINSAGNVLINESAQISYGGNVPKLEVLGASVASTDADGGTVGVIGSTNTAGAGGALVLGSLFQTGAWATFARVRASKDTATSGEYGGGLAFDTRPNLGNLTQRMLITSAGNLLVGTTSAAIFDTNAGADVSTFYRMQVTGGDGNTNYGIAISNGSGDAGYGIWVVNSAAKRIRIASFQSSATVATAGSEASFASFATMTAGALTEKMRIDSSGNLLVGTTSSSAPSNGFVFSPGSQLVSIGHVNGTGSGENYTAYYYNSTLIGGITQNGTTGVLYNTSSDARLKHDIVDAPDAASLIDAIQVRSFKWNADNSEQRYGFIAQELVAIAPEAVSQPEDPDKMMGVDYSKLVPMMMKELQSLRARVAQLEGN